MIYKVRIPCVTTDGLRASGTTIVDTSELGEIPLEASYGHRFFSDVFAHVQIVAPVGREVMVWFSRHNVTTDETTPYYWPVSRFAKFFEFGSVVPAGLAVS